VGPSASLTMNCSCMEIVANIRREREASCFCVARVARNLTVVKEIKKHDLETDNLVIPARVGALRGKGGWGPQYVQLTAQHRRVTGDY